MTLPMVSVIIPTRNRLGFLKEAVASVSAQDYAKRETIVVDDASEDGTWEWLSSLQDPQVRILRPPHHVERSAARNLGLSHAQGEYVMFLDDDDLLVADALSYLCEAFRRHPEALAVAGARISFDDRGNWYRPPHPRWAFAGKAWQDILFGCIPPQGQTLVRKSAVLAAGGWNESWSVGEDHEIWLRLVTEHSVIAIIPRTVRKMRIHAGQTPLIITARDCVKMRRDFVSRLAPATQDSGWKIHHAQRLFSLATRYEARHRHGKAVSFNLLALAKARALLARPMAATFLLEGLSRSLVGFIFGETILTRAQKAKGFLRRARGMRVGVSTR